MKSTIKVENIVTSEELEVFEYLARLNGLSTDTLLSAILNRWLHESYPYAVREAEEAYGLPSSAGQKGEYRPGVMRANAEALRVASGEVGELFQA